MLEQELAAAGAEMLVDVLKQRRFVPPHEDVGWYARSDGPIDHAPKVTKQDRYIDFKIHSLADVIAKHNALGDLWCLLPTGDRLIIHEFIHGIPYSFQSFKTEPGLFVGAETRAMLPYRVKGPLRPVVEFKGACGGIGYVQESTLQGHKTGSGNAKLLSLFGPSTNTSVGTDAIWGDIYRVI